MEHDFIERIKRMNRIFNEADEFYSDRNFDKTIEYDDVTITITPKQEEITKYFLISNLNSLFLNHSTGSGKTILAVSIINNLLTIYHSWEAVILCKKSIFEQWEKALNFKNNKINTILFNYKNNKNLVNVLNSYNKIKYSNRILLIIDEVHNLTSVLNNEESTLGREIYNSIYKFCNNFNPKLLCLSATPIVNSPDEFLYICKLLKYSVSFPMKLFSGNNFIYKKNILSTMIGTFSVFSVVNDDIFENVPLSKLYPARNVFIEKLEIPESHLRIYKKSLNLNKDRFKIVHKMILNLNHKHLIEADTRASKGYSDFMREKITATTDHEELRELSVKFYRTIELIQGSKGKCIVYIKYLGLAGISSLEGYMKAFGISYEVLTSKTKNINDILDRFNADSNLYGEEIKVILFSDIAGEGINFFAVETQILLSVPWNETSYIQILGRSFRQGRHNVKPIEERYINIYILLAVSQALKTDDEYMLEFVENKRNRIRQVKEIINSISLEHVKEVANGNFGDAELFDYHFVSQDTYKYEKIKKNKI